MPHLNFVYAETMNSVDESNRNAKVNCPGGIGVGSTGKHQRYIFFQLCKFNDSVSSGI